MRKGRAAWRRLRLADWILRPGRAAKRAMRPYVCVWMDVCVRDEKRGVRPDLLIGFFFMGRAHAMRPYVCPPDGRGYGWMGV
jgi:hypothetical protein